MLPGDDGDSNQNSSKYLSCRIMNESEAAANAERRAESSTRLTQVQQDEAPTNGQTGPTDDCSRFLTQLTNDQVFSCDHDAKISQLQRVKEGKNSQRSMKDISQSRAVVPDRQSSWKGVSLGLHWER